MSKKLGVLLTAIVGALETVGLAVVAYVQPAQAVAITATVSAVCACAVTVINAWTKEK